MENKMKTVMPGNNTLTNDQDFFDTRYYSVNKRILSLVGQWPYQSTFERTVRTTVVLLLGFTLLIPQMLKAIESWGEVNLFIECFSPLLTHIGCMIKLLNGIINTKKLKKLLHETRTDWESWPHAYATSILRECGERGRRFTIYYMTMIYISVLAWILMPTVPKVMDLVAPLNYTRPNIILFQTNYKIDQERYFYPILLHGSFVCLSSILMLVSIDTLYMVMAQHVRGMFEILRYRLENVIQEDAKLKDDMFEPNLREDICYQEIISCMKTHKRTIKYIKLMESSNEWCLILVLSFSMLLMSCTGSRSCLKTVAAETGTQDALRFGCFTIAQMTHLFCNTLPGQWVMDASTLVRVYSYNARWYMMSRRSRGLIVLLIRRATTPCTIAAGKLYIMSMENFSSVLQTSMSYFTLLTSMQ